MDSAANSRRCKKVKFKCKQFAYTSYENGSPAFNEQLNTTKSHIDCQPIRSSAVTHMLTLLLILSYCITDIESSAVGDLYRNRLKRYADGNSTTLAPDLPTRPDTVCNQDSLYECVCNRSLGNLDDRILLCDRFLEDNSFTILSLLVHNIDLDVRLHTNELYQHYFRRRIANIISQYCKHQANECPGTILTLNRNNVIILRVNYLPHQQTEIQIVVAKESTPKKLNEATLIDPKTVKHILVTQLAPLSRVLGGVKIEKLELVQMDRKTVTAQNNNLINLLTVIAVAMAFCYAVACFKVWRDTFRKRQSKKKEEMLAARNQQNYGACTYKLQPSCDAPNGKIDFKNDTGQASVNSSTKDNRSITHSSKDSSNKKDLAQTEIDINKQNISKSEISLVCDANNTRSFQRMFACDLSQLPAESCDLIDEGLDTVFVEDNGLNEFQTSPKYSNSFAYNGLENAKTHLGSAESPPNASVTNRWQPSIVPIFIASDSQLNIDKEPSIIVEKPMMEVSLKPEYVHPTSSSSAVGVNQHLQEMSSYLLNAMTDTAPFVRPLSRRGSRESTPEQGEEFADNLSTDSLQPLGDKNFESHESKQTKSKNPEIAFDQSSSESEDETNELYHKLNEEREDEPGQLYHKPNEEECEEDEIDETGELYPKVNEEREDETSELYPEVNEEREDETGQLYHKLNEDREEGEEINLSKSEFTIIEDSDDELLNESRMLERHAYRRLEESPLTSPSICTINNLVADDAQLKNNSDKAIGDLAEQTLSDYEDLR